MQLSWIAEGVWMCGLCPINALPVLRDSLVVLRHVLTAIDPLRPGARRVGSGEWSRGQRTPDGRSGNFQGLPEMWQALVDVTEVTSLESHH